MTPDEREFRDRAAIAMMEAGAKFVGLMGEEALVAQSFDIAHAMLEERRKREGEERCMRCGT